MPLPKTTICFALLFAVSLCANDALAVKPSLDFANDIAPIFTKLGCNSGACHGKSTGRGGFKLSLFGFHPDRDYVAITRSSRGRRVFPASPDESLLLLKATMLVPHGGGRRMAKSQPEYERLRNWIAHSLPWRTGKRIHVTRLLITPAIKQIRRSTRQPLTATAVYSDGTRRDVTRLTRVRSNDTSVATVGKLGAVQTGKRYGETAIVGLYQGKVAVSRVLVPRETISNEGQSRLQGFRRGNFIDDHIRSKLRQLRIPPARMIGDAKFVRRATLQIAGRLPTVEETDAFVKNRAPDKRRKLVDRLLASGDYADHFAQKWCDILRIKRRGQKTRVAGTIIFHRWVRNSIAINKPYDQFVRELITASGNVAVTPTAQWYAEVRYLERYVDDTAQAFLGIRIGCARCHHHPFEQFSQTDYYGLAAFFGRVARTGGTGVAERRANEQIFVKPSGSVRHPQTKKVVLPRGLGGRPLTIPQYADPRHNLVDWMVESDNPYFAKAFVNRMWSHFFGRGLVDPMDDMRVTNPPSNGPLLNALANEFVRSRFDMKHIVRLICNSTTYQLESIAEGPTLDDDTSHARFYPQRLSAEVLLDSIDYVTKSQTRYRGLPAGTRAVQLPDEGYSNEFLRLFGRPQRESACECERTAEPSLSQSLYVANNRFVLNKISTRRGFTIELVKQKRKAKVKIRRMFLRALCREPDAREYQAALDYLKQETDANKAYGNLLWALINTKEFLFVH